MYVDKYFLHMKYPFALILSLFIQNFGTHYVIFINVSFFFICRWKKKSESSSICSSNLTSGSSTTVDISRGVPTTSSGVLWDYLWPGPSFWPPRSSNIQPIYLTPIRTIFVGVRRILSTLMLNCQFLPCFLSLTLFLTYFYLDWPIFLSLIL